MEKICKVCGKNKFMMPWEDTCRACEKEQRLKRIQDDIVSGDEDVDTFSSDYIICPYCGYASSDEYGYVDFPEMYEDGEHEVECGECGKTFILETNVSYSWETRKEN